MEPSALEPLYYHQDYLTLIRWVLARYPDFWSEPEQDQITCFLGLPSKAQALVIRLLNRKGCVFRVSRLKYPELGSLDEWLEALEHAQFVDFQRTQSENAQCLAKVPLAELQAWQGTRASKSQCVEMAIGRTDLDQWLGRDWLVLRCQNLFDRFRVLFFGNIHQDMTEFVLTGMGLQTFEDYEVDPHFRRFRNRTDLENMMRWACWWADSYATDQELGPIKDWVGRCEEGLKELPDPWRKYPLRFLCRLGLAQMNQDPEWAKRCLFRYLDEREDWEVRARLVRWLKKRGEGDLAQALLDQEESELTPLAQQAYAKLRHQLKSGPAPQTLLQPQPKPVVAAESQASERGGKRRYCGEDAEWSTIETFVLSQYRKQGWDGFFAENGWIQSVLGLWARECVFASVPGAFDHPFQDAPLDLGSEFFFKQRQAIFRAWAEQWRQSNREDWLDHLGSVWLKHGHKRARFYHCSPFSWEVTRTVLAAYPLKAWIELALRFFQLKRSLWRGFPDLVLFREGRVVFAEVKAIKEQVSDYQKNWHHELLRLGFEVWLVRVVVRGEGAASAAPPVG
ncbi:MAG: VRR-NUC domain-containing protein [Acidobacteria bacterium]|nr:VRR-NUC domain-containing protein [Acidobacteriota bacterium]MCB9398723.1 VRR-NUC domain-containing protein [Acidobacteriota bacterium]